MKPLPQEFKVLVELVGGAIQLGRLHTDLCLIICGHEEGYALQELNEFNI
jgi:hypothetical protein